MLVSPRLYRAISVLTSSAAYNVALVISDGITARVGSLTANKERFMPWNTIKNEDDRPLLEYQLEKVVRGFFDPELFLDYMRYFVLFEDDGDSLIKKIAGYHQFHGVREAVRVTTIAAADSDEGVVRERRATYGDEVQPGSRKAGVFWHTPDAKESRDAENAEFAFAEILCALCDSAF